MRNNTDTICPKCGHTTVIIQFASGDAPMVVECMNPICKFNYVKVENERYRIIKITENDPRWLE